ncbi:glycoside hydrolase family 43 protein [Actinophytocola sediminis]
MSVAGEENDRTPSERGRRQVLRAGVGVVAGSLALGGMPAAGASGPERLPWVADLGDGRYRNPVLYADWSDPDAVRVGRYFYLVASTFNRIPGLPILRSTDLVNWTVVGHALTELAPRDHFSVPQHGNGVWAPAIRHHDGKFWIFYPDPDFGIFVTTATDPRGPWTAPHPLKPGLGFIDPCPLWDDDGQAYLIHAWAKSRAGINNLLTLHRMNPDGTSLLDEGTTVVNGDEIPGYTTLEGPKLYKRDGWYWIFAPAGGVKRGWQSAFRSRTIWGPYEDRIVLAQGNTPINGPHQGAWVTTEAGEDWFVHFQDQEAYGRVVHLQPMRWRDDGWPVMGTDDGNGLGSPVLVHTKPRVDRPERVTAPATSDEFTAPGLSEQWVWQANADPAWWRLRRNRLTLDCSPSPVTHDLRLLGNVLGQRLPAESCTATTSMTLTTTAPGSRAGLVVLGATYAWLGLWHDGEQLVLACRTAAAGGVEIDAAASVPLERQHTSVRLKVSVTPGAVCQFAADVDGVGYVPVGAPFPATPGKWIGATVGLFATAPESAGQHGTAEFDWFRVRPGE